MCLSAYAFFQRKIGMSSLCFTNLTYFFAVLVAVLPGYSIASGRMLLHTDIGEFDIVLYFLYILFLVLSTIFLLFGQVSGNALYISMKVRKAYKHRVAATTMIVLAYSVAYLIWLPKIPINALIAGDSIFEVIKNRLEITHEIDVGTLPYVFRFWRVVMQPIFAALFLYWFSTLSFQKHKVILLVLFLSGCYFNIFTLEKAPIVEFLFSIILLISVQKELDGRQIFNIQSIAMVTVLICLVGYLFYFFMDDVTPFESAWNRLMLQTASSYYVHDLVRNQTGLLGLKGLDLHLVRYIFDIERVDLSRQVQATFFSFDGLAGAAGGFSLADIYFALGWFSLPVFSFYAFMIGFLDRVISNSVSRTADAATKSVCLAFYCAFSSYYILTLTGSVFSIFSITLFFNPLVHLIIACFLFLVSCRIVLRR